MPIISQLGGKRSDIKSEMMKAVTRELTKKISKAHYSSSVFYSFVTAFIPNDTPSNCSLKGFYSKIGVEKASAEVSAFVTYTNIYMENFSSSVISFLR